MAIRQPEDIQYTICAEDGEVHLGILTKPEPHQRPRSVSKGGKSWIYQPRTDMAEEIKRVAKAWIDEHEPDLPIVRGRARCVVLLGQARPSGDVDNIVKAIFDAMQDTRLIKDDKLIDDVIIMRQLRQDNLQVCVAIQEVEEPFSEEAGAMDDRLTDLCALFGAIRVIWEEQAHG